MTSCRFFRDLTNCKMSNHGTMKQRSFTHDYSQRATYLVTLVVDGRKPLLGTIAGDATIPHGYPGEPYTSFTQLGKEISANEIPKIEHYYPDVKVWKTCIMPDHIHMIVRVERALPPGVSLGTIINSFKSGCNTCYWRIFNYTESPRKGLFERGYNDRILLNNPQLDRWKRYLADNPRRLLVKRNTPGFFTVLHEIDIMGEKCQIVGNRFLLDHPEKMAVIVHRRYTPQETALLREQWLACGASGGVLVSAAISPSEKEVMREAMDRGYSIILLRENGFPPLYKPSGESFNACSAGHLLQVSPWQYHTRKATITREQCLHLNALALKITHNK